jgi:hypothetical protein
MAIARTLLPRLLRLLISSQLTAQKRLLSAFASRPRITGKKFCFRKQIEIGLKTKSAISTEASGLFNQREFRPLER